MKPKRLVASVAALVLSACSAETDNAESDSILSVLTLNLHTYQEIGSGDTPESELTAELAQERVEAYGPILDRIAAGIEELDPNIVCLQEVGEWAGPVRGNPANVEFGATDTNMVHQILARVNEDYDVYMNWSHYGWDVWFEGSAILSRHPFESTESRFISEPRENRYESWKSRNVPMAQVDVPELSDVAIFSVHTGWWDDEEEPSRGQYKRLFDWTQEIDGEEIVLCGDFNAPAGGAAYDFLTKDYLDAYLAANPDGMDDATIGAGAHGWEKSIDSERIDYVLVHEESRLSVVRARRVFTDVEFGRVSDHVGVYVEFELTR